MVMSMENKHHREHSKKISGLQLAELLSWFSLTRDGILDRFSRMAAQSFDRGEGDRRFVYIPGDRNHRVLLVAHADSVWDDQEGFPAPVEVRDGVLRSADPARGIGADDRAGCAILWQLRHLGHSLLVTSGEEKGCLASRWLMEENVDLAEEINGAHQFVVEFDRRNRSDFKCYEVGTDPFRDYCHKMTGFTDAGRSSSTDIVTLCRNIPGVNLSAGFYAEHSVEECLHVGDWARSLEIARRWLSAPVLPQFRLPGAPVGNNFSQGKDVLPVILPGLTTQEMGQDCSQDDSCVT